MYSVHVFLDSDVSCHRFIKQLFIFKIKFGGQVSYDNKDVTYIHTICTSTRRLRGYHWQPPVLFPLLVQSQLNGLKFI